MWWDVKDYANSVLEWWTTSAWPIWFLKFCLVLLIFFPIIFFWLWESVNLSAILAFSVRTFPLVTTLIRVTSSVPQGSHLSHLGSLLLTLFVNDLPLVLTLCTLMMLSCISNIMSPHRASTYNLIFMRFELGSMIIN